MIISQNLPINQQYFIMMGKENFLKTLCNEFIDEFNYGTKFDSTSSDFEKEIASSIYKTIKSNTAGVTFLQSLINGFTEGKVFKSFKHLNSQITITLE